MTAPHQIESPRPDRYPARPLVVDGVAVVNAVPVAVVVPCAGITTAFVRILSTAGGTLELRLRRTNATEYPVAFGPANTTVVANTALEVEVAVKGCREFVARFVPSAGGVVTYWDVGFLLP